MTSFEIQFTLDTICPWTYIAKRRLDLALQRFAASDAGKNAKFVVKYLPYQLYPEASQEDQEKAEFYKKTNYAQTEDRFKMYQTYMQALGVGVGIDFSFSGLISNTLHAHRLIQYFQEENGPETADKIVNSLYKQYFEQEKSPSANDTLTKAALDAGISANNVESFVANKNKYLDETKMEIREQAGNGVDSVPYIVLEGKRRDLTLIGAKEIEEYVKALEMIVKESK